MFDDGSDPDPAELVKAADDIGYPVLVKAAFGGGGRGMRIVNHQSEVAEAVASARREAASAFGNGTVFLERFVDSPRHIEVQIFGDQAGTVVHLFERECSIQRRYQKIVEEAPSPAVGPELRERLCQAAVAAGKAIGYVGAGTVEFVLDASGRFYFLEVNTRLQVEHPVTELITGLDLVKVQLEVAAGQPLPPEVTGATFTGHAIEARLYAEDVPAGYLPASGDVHTFDIPAHDVNGTAGLRVDAGFASGTRVSTFYDSMLAKVIGYGADPRRRPPGTGRCAVPGPAARRGHQPGPAGRDPARAGVRGRGHRHRLPDRHPPEELTPARGAVPPEHVLAVALAEQARRRPRTPRSWPACPLAGVTTPAPPSGPATPPTARSSRSPTPSPAMASAPRSAARSIQRSGYTKPTSHISPRYRAGPASRTDRPPQQLRTHQPLGTRSTWRLPECAASSTCTRRAAPSTSTAPWVTAC